MRAVGFSFILFLVQFSVLGQDPDADFWDGNDPSEGYSFTAPDGTRYIQYSPPSYDGSEAYGLLIYLHGGQAIISAANDGSTEPYYAAFYGPPKVIESGRWDDSLKLIVVAPHLQRDTDIPNYNDQEWDVTRIKSVIDDVKSNLNINNNKVYITGISVGGKAVYDMLGFYPNEFAAGVPFSANAPLGNVCDYKDTPIWGFHGNEDGLVLYNDTRDGIRYGTKVVIDAINACSQAPAIPARYTEFDMYDHYGWQQTYEDLNGYDIYSYMLALERNSTQNIAPFVTAMGPDMIIEQRDGTFSLLGRVYDADGTISNVEWSSILSSSPQIEICNANQETLILDDLAVGAYTFRLTATDNDGATTSDDFNLQVVSAGDRANEVSELSLVTVGNASNVLQVLEQDAVINLADYDLTSIELDFVGDTDKTNKRYGWDYNRYYEQYFNATRTMKQNRVPNFEPISLGTHYLYSAIFAKQWAETPRDTSWLQYRIHVVNETEMTLPTPPDVSATALNSGTQIQLTWSDAGNTTNRFEIQRSGCASESFSTIATTDIGETSYTDSGLPLGETYRYRLRAVDDDQFSAFARQIVISTLDAPLPVSLIYFKAANKGNKTSLTWATAKEENHAFFELQRSEDAENWEKLHTVPGEGDYEGVRRYSFTDKNPGQGIVYYRLMQQDYDGTTTYSDLARVNMSNAAASIAFYPNPAGPGQQWRANITGMNDGEKVLISLYDSKGQRMYENTLTVANLRNKTSWQPANLRPGIYMLMADTPAGQFSQRMVVK